MMRVLQVEDSQSDVALVADLVHQAPAPRRTALEGERGVELVRAGVDPAAQPVAAGLLEGGALQRPVFERHDLPAKGAEHRLDALPQPLADVTHRQGEREELGNALDREAGGGIAGAELRAFAGAQRNAQLRGRHARQRGDVAGDRTAAELGLEGSDDLVEYLLKIHG